MSAIFQYVSDKWSQAIGASWEWFSLLNREEWIIVLAVGCTLGFLCMRGFGSRANY